jgi:thiamine biosynthesis protein ThiI
MANELAKKSGAMAIVTGEGLAQVASQTLDNLAILDQASDLPVFRPLIGNDKEENVRLARQIGTYESSCMPVMTCQAVPRRPATRAKLDQIIHLEQMLGMNGLLKRSLSTLATR